MIRVTIELLPGGDERKAKVLGTGFIANDGTGTEKRGNYRASFLRQRAHQISTVKNFARKSRTAWDLLMEALNNRR